MNYLNFNNIADKWKNFTFITERITSSDNEIFA